MITEAMGRFIAQRSGIDCRNYGSRAGFRHDYLRILRDGRDARLLLRFVGLYCPNYLPEVLRSGRLTWDGARLDYCTGQYFPTEYRAAACHALASAIWNWLRVECGCNTAEKIQAAARREFGFGIAKRWFF